MKEHRFDIEGREHVATVRDSSREPGQPTHVEVDGTVHTVLAPAASPSVQVAVRMDGKPARLTVVEGQDGSAWVCVDGRARLVSELSQNVGSRAASRERKHGRGAQKQVTPLYPASVIKVLVAVGDEVVRGQGLVTVSAMKTEMTLAAPYGGTVRAINAEVGDKVSPGDVLVEVEAAEEQTA